jgi:hypothetical protein
MSFGNRTVIHNATAADPIAKRTTYKLTLTGRS